MTANLLASFISKGWSALLSLAFVPLYIRFLGVEAYGLIGSFLALQTILYLLDLGLGAAITREFAGSTAPRPRQGDLLRTVEIIYAAIAVGIAAVVWLLAPLIAGHWLKPGAISVAHLTSALRLAGLAFALQWSTNLYAAALTGLQQQVRLGVVIGSAGTIRALSSALGLWLVAPTLTVFFLAQAASNLLQTLVLRSMVWRSISKGIQSPCSFDVRLLHPLLGFVTGMAGISVTTVVLTQLDKVILSKTLTLEAFGYYTIAGTLANSLLLITSPMFAVLFPRFAEFVARMDKAALKRLYHLANQFMAVLIWPTAAILALFSYRLLQIWTGSDRIASNSHLLLTVLVFGNAINGLMNVPYAMQLAQGWTRLAFFTNLAAMVVCAPLTYFLSVRLGALGGALMWPLLMMGAMVSHVYFTHRRFALGPVRTWYIFDVGIPGVIAFSVVGLAAFYRPAAHSRTVDIALIAAVMLVAAFAALLAAPLVRGLARLHLRDILVRIKSVENHI